MRNAAFERRHVGRCHSLELVGTTTLQYECTSGCLTWPTEAAVERSNALVPMFRTSTRRTGPHEARGPAAARTEAGAHQLTHQTLA